LPAPPSEPISGEFHIISTLYALTRHRRRPATGGWHWARRRELRQDVLWRVIAVCWRVAGVAWIAFGALNYFTHTSLIVNENK